MSARRWVSLLCATLPLFATAGEPSPVAGDAFYKGKSDGWFWYKDPPPIEEEEPTPPDTGTPIVSPGPVSAEPAKPKAPPVFSVAWLREKLPEARESAIDDPSPENMQRYYYLQRIAMDKAQRFADVSRVITMSDPLIDESIRRSTSSFAANAQTKTAGEAQNELLKTLSKKVGLFYFYKANCDLCTRQLQVLKSFKFSTDFTIIPISLDGSFLEGNSFGAYRRDSGQAKMLRISDAPAIALAIPPKSAQIVSFAPIAADALRSRIVLVAKTAGVITEDQYRQTLPYNDTGYLLAEGMDGMEPDMIDDPKKFTEFIRQQAEATQNGGKNNSSFSPRISMESQNTHPTPNSLDSDPLNYFSQPVTTQPSEADLSLKK